MNKETFVALGEFYQKIDKIQSSIYDLLIYPKEIFPGDSDDTLSPEYADGILTYLTRELLSKIFLSEGIPEDDIDDMIGAMSDVAFNAPLTGSDFIIKDFSDFWDYDNPFND